MLSNLQMTFIVIASQTEKYTLSSINYNLKFASHLGYRVGQRAQIQYIPKFNFEHTKRTAEYFTQ